MESSLLEWLEEMVRGIRGGWYSELPGAEVFEGRVEQARELESELAALKKENTTMRGRLAGELPCSGCQALETAEAKIEKVREWIAPRVGPRGVLIKTWQSDFDALAAIIDEEAGPS